MNIVIIHLTKKCASSHGGSVSLQLSSAKVMEHGQHAGFTTITPFNLVTGRALHCPRMNGVQEMCVDLQSIGVSIDFARKWV